MPIFETIEEFLEHCPEGVLLGLDFGDKTIGVAVSDTMRTVATARETIRRKKFTVDSVKLADLITATEAKGLIIGMPFNMDGSEGDRCQKSRAFARNLTKLFDLPIGYWDERLSTAAATRIMYEAGLSRAKRAKAVDNVAAGYILQGALNRLSGMREK